jgi:hypothetical protein
LQPARLDSHEPAKADSLHAAAYEEAHRRHAATPCSGETLRTRQRLPPPEASP